MWTCLVLAVYRAGAGHIVRMYGGVYYEVASRWPSQMDSVALKEITLLYSRLGASP